MKRSRSTYENEEKMELSVLENQEWQWFLTFASPYLEHHYPPQILCKSPITILNGQLSLVYKEKTYTIHVQYDWPLYAIVSASSSLECPFRLVGCFYIDDNDAVHLPFYELWLNSRLLQQHITNLGRIPKEVLVTRVLRMSMTQAFGSQRLAAQFQTQPKKVTATLEWMRHLETRIKTSQNTFCVNDKCVPIGDTRWGYYRSRDLVMPLEEQNSKTDLTKLSFWGGILCTADAQSLLAELLADKTNLDTWIAQLPDTSTYYPSTATLVILDADLVQVWEKAFQKLGLKDVIKVASWADVDKVTDEQVQKAHIIFTTYQFLTTKRYHDGIIHYCRQQLGDNDSPTYYMSQPATIRVATRTAKSLKIAATTLSPLSCFFFHRLIYVDLEHLVHTCVKKPVRSVPSLDGLVTWGCSSRINIGSTGHLQHYAKIIRCDISAWTLECMENLVENAFVQCEMPPPPQPVPQNIITVDLSAAERQILQYHSQTRRKISVSEQVQLCTYRHYLFAHPHPKILGQSLADILNLVILPRQEKLLLTRESVQTHEQKLLQLANEYAAGRLPLEQYQGKRDTLQNHIHNVRRNLETREKSLQFFAEACKQGGGGAKCPVCLEEDTNTITICGHWFCLSCLMEHFHSQSVCPMCKFVLKEDETFYIQDLSHEQSTKLQRLLQHLQQYPTRQFVIGVQFLSLWSTLPGILCSQGIKCAPLTGNMRTRQCALGRFSRGETRVLLVKLGDMVPGMIIDTPSHLIFLHALVGEPGEKEQVYNKARNLFGSRGPVDITWFLAQNSVEMSINTSF